MKMAQLLSIFVGAAVSLDEQAGRRSGSQCRASRSHHMSRRRGSGSITDAN
jgi:hypothetical protein